MHNVLRWLFKRALIDIFISVKWLDNVRGIAQSNGPAEFPSAPLKRFSIFQLIGFMVQNFTTGFTLSCCHQSLFQPLQEAAFSKKKKKSSDKATTTTTGSVVRDLPDGDGDLNRGWGPLEQFSLGAPGPRLAHDWKIV